MLSFIALSAAVSISEVQLIPESGATFLSFKYAPTEPQATIVITPPEMELLSGGLFSLSENLTLNFNLSTPAYLYDIETSANETLYSGSLNAWCGSVFDDCGNCAGMPPGTFKWCNGAYPQRTYSCDNWCYTYSPKPAFEKTMVGGFSKMRAFATIEIEKFPKARLLVSESNPIRAAENASAELIFPSLQPPIVAVELIRPLSDRTWKSITPSQLQSYKSNLFSYYSQYTQSIDSAHSATNSLNSALAELSLNSQGNHLDYYELSSPEAQFPQIRIKMESNYAGVEAIRGRPEALLLQSTVQFDAGLPYYQFDLKNAGPVSDNFIANLSCNGSVISSTSAVLIEAGNVAPLKFFVPQITFPTLCTAYAFLLGSLLAPSSISSTLEPFKIPCPQAYECCSVSETHEEKSCLDATLFKEEDGYGGGYYYLQHYSCIAQICAENSTTFIRRVEGNKPPLQYSFSSNPSNSAISQPALQKTSPSPTPSPTLNLPRITPISPTPPALKSIPLEEEKIEIIAPSEITEGYGTVVVRANSKPAQGSILVLSPSMKRRTLPLDLGSTDVLFNEEGEWKISYSFEQKKINVLPFVSPNALNERKDSTASTSFLTLGFSSLPLPEICLALSFAIFGFALHKKVREKVHFRKSFENNIVRLEIQNNRSDLTNLEITDIAPEGTILSTISNPPSEVTEIIFGKHIKWKKSLLRKGERMLISYSIFTNSPSGSLRPAEIQADAEGNKRILVLSNAVELQAA